MIIGIYGYGNLGKGVECAVAASPDMQIGGVFTRRDPASVKTLTGAPVYSAGDASSFKDKIDVMILCGGSAKDLPELMPLLSRTFNTVDSFDTHAHIPEHFERTDAAAKETGHTALISAGWDPGLFSLARVLGGAVLPDGRDYTFWGRGVSQGHSDAIRRIPGVKDARQYTVPVASAIDQVRSGSCPELTVRQKHTRECYVVPEEGADTEAIRRAIVTMPDYFADYDTTVNFVTEEQLLREHGTLPHGGFVIRSGFTGPDRENRHTVEFNLKLDSNPQFTGSVLTACARAVYRLHERGETGCRTLLDVAPALLSPLSPEELRKKLL